MSDSQYTSAEQKTIISAGLNAFILTAALLGIYTVVYLGTLHIYSTRKANQNRMVISTISTAYALFVVLCGVNWYAIKCAVVDSGDTQVDIFAAIFNQPPWITLTNNVCNFLMAALADGLLIWRCFNVWDRSIRAILLPSFLLLCEIGTGLALIIIAGLDNLGTSPSDVDVLNTILGVSTFMTLATTLATTVLISYRIYSVSKGDLPRSSRARFRNIIEILTQSAAAYAIVALASAITVVVPLNDNNVAQVFSAETYVSSVYAFTSGVVPTIMVARVALASDTSRDASISVITRVSGLRFHGQASTVPETAQFSRGGESVHANVEDSHSALPDSEKWPAP